MFSMSILDSDAFLEMPQSTQNLYMHMAMRADDDGFLGNPKRIMRMVGAGDDDYKVLIAKKFVLVFEDGICVIKHWLIHNTIRRDRYEETVYKDHKQQLNVKENKAYSLGIPSGNHLATTGSHSIEENSIEENKTEQKKLPQKISYGEFGNVKLSENEHSKLIEQLNEKAVTTLIGELDQYIESTGKKYKSHYATIQTWARRRIEQHVAEVKNKKNIVAF
jgi:hypothetical protein